MLSSAQILPAIMLLSPEPHILGGDTFLGYLGWKSFLEVAISLLLANNRKGPATAL